MTTAHRTSCVPVAGRTVRKVRSDKGCRHKNLEAQLQAACTQWGRGQGMLIVPQLAGARFLHGGRTWKAMQAKGAEPGVPDLLILEAGADGSHGLAVELKVERNSLSDAQRAWFARARAKGWRCAVANSVEEFVELVQEHVSGVVVID